MKTKQIDPTLPEKHPADAVFCCLGGTEYNLLGLIETRPAFDFLLDDDDIVEEGRTVLPRSLVQQSLRAKMRTSLARTDQASALFSVPFTVVAPPPPFRDLGDEAVLPTAFQVLRDQGIAPGALRLRLYRLQNRILQDHCAQANIDFLPAPAEASDDDGFLRAECWDRDPTHGNARYGKMVIDQIRTTLDARQTSL